MRGAKGMARRLTANSGTAIDKSASVLYNGSVGRRNIIHAAAGRSIKMKTVAKVFLILGLVSVGLTLMSMILLAALFGIVGSTQPTEEVAYASIAIYSMLAVVIVCSIPAIIFHVLGLKKLSAARCKADVPVWLGVCVLLLGGNLIAGILMLCLSDSDFPAPQPAYGQTYFQPGAGQPAYQPVNSYYQGNGTSYGSGYGCQPTSAPQGSQSTQPAGQPGTDAGKDTP